MAMNLGIRPNILFINTSYATNAKFMKFNTNGTYSDLADTMSEAVYIDLGIVTDVRNDNTIGTINFNLPFTKNTSNFVWAVGSKISRITVSGIIPEGQYVSGVDTHLSDTPPAVCTNIYDLDELSLGPRLRYRSNTSVFLYKMNKHIAGQSISTSSSGTSALNLEPCICHFYYPGIKMVGDTSDVMMKYTVVGFGYSYINGTKHLQYSLSLELNYNGNPSYTPLDIGVMFS